MAIGMMRGDQTPRVQDHEGKVAIWAEATDGEACGVIMDVPAAVTAAARLLRQGAEIRGDALPAIPVGDVSIDVREAPGEDLLVRLVFEVDGAPLAATVDLTQFAEITAAFARVSREIDRTQRPRTDR